MSEATGRYHRQQILPMIGEAGMARLRQASVLLIGVGALGGTIADQLVRAGIGRLRLVDRDLVDWTNLHRQVLFSEQDARDATPKAIAAAVRLAAVNSDVALDPLVLDVHSANIEQLAGFPHETATVTAAGLASGGRKSPGLSTPRPERAHEALIPDAAQLTRSPDAQLPALITPFRADLILDGTDNAETRYLINDLAVKHGIPWVYGACVGVEGRIMPILPGRGPCLRCIFPQSPRSGELATCDTAGILGPAAAVIAALQASLAIRILVSDENSDWSPVNRGALSTVGNGAMITSSSSPLGEAGRGLDSAHEMNAAQVEMIRTGDDTPVSISDSATASPESGHSDPIHLLSLDAWTLRVHALDVTNARQPDCPACGLRRFDFLSLPLEINAAALCGRHAVQVRSGLTISTLDLTEIARRLTSAGQVQALPYLVRCKLTHSPQITLSVFADGRTVVDGTTDIAQARTLVARYVGA